MQVEHSRADYRQPNANTCATHKCIGVPDIFVQFAAGAWGVYCGACIPKVCRAFDIAFVEIYDG